MSQSLGVIGLGTMGASLARNAARKGATVAVFNRTTEKMEEFVARYGKEGTFVACTSMKALVKELPPPRMILLMVKAGEAVDAMIAELVPLLSKGDMLIDAGNSHYKDTARRERELATKGMHFVGIGVSGGEEGALNGPSMMPGGSKEAYRVMEPLLKKMAADDGAGGKCVTHVGPEGAGHFVKMVHNGIEYGLMQLIGEAYDVLKSIGGLTNAELAETFDAWNGTEELGSFLLGITADIFRRKDGDAVGDLIDVIKDKAKQKGTGKWTTEAAMDFGQAIPTINAAVDARILSGSAERETAQQSLPEALIEDTATPSKEKLVSLTRHALELSVITAYNQGFRLIENAGNEMGWHLHMAEIARIWRGGCIIRAHVLATFQAAYDTSDAHASATASKAITGRFESERQRDWRRVVSLAQERGIPVPGMSSALSYYDALRRERLPTNLIQAQRDFFGAHGFERTDQPGAFHHQWSGKK